MEETSRLIELINKGYSVSEISEALNLSHHDIYKRLTELKNMGNNYIRKYYYSGDIVYESQSTIAKRNSADIITSSSDKSFRCLAISDTHIGCTKERLDLLNLIYDYCKKNDIHIILHGGDLINGMFGLENIHDNIYEQIKHCIDNYPFDKSILNFVIMGNHDIDALLNYNQDLQEALNNYRHDIVPLGYGEGSVNVKNESIFLKHPLELNDNSKVTYYDNCVILCGHRHKCKFSVTPNKQLILLPSLSDIMFTEDSLLPGAVLMELKFQEGYFVSGNFRQLLINNRVNTINEIVCEINRNIKHNSPVRLEEDREKRLTLIPGQISQIERFKKRYGME